MKTVLVFFAFMTEYKTMGDLKTIDYIWYTDPKSGKSESMAPASGEGLLIIL
jgi:hypothetical protein